MITGLVILLGAELKGASEAVLIESRRRLGSAQQIALGFVAAPRLQKAALFFGLHAFGDDAEIHVVRESDDRSHQMLVVWARGEPAHEALIDLEVIERESLKVAER